MNHTKKLDVQIDRCWVTCNGIGFGVTQFTCFSPIAINPVGLVWAVSMGPGNAGKSRVETYHSYTVPWARRQGVRTLINRKIFEDHGVDVITTQQGSEDGGLAFLRASGYRLDRATGIWSLTKRAWQRRTRRPAR